MNRHRGIKRISLTAGAILGVWTFVNTYCDKLDEGKSAMVSLMRALGEGLINFMTAAIVAICLCLLVFWLVDGFRDDKPQKTEGAEKDSEQ